MRRLKRSAKKHKDLLDKALVEKEKAAEEAATSNPVESAANSAEKAKNLSLEVLASMTKLNNMTSEISEGKDASLKVVVDNATKVAKEIQEIAERSKESKDEKEKVDLAKEAEKELKIVEQAKAVVEKALDEIKEEEEIKRNGSNKKSEEIKREIIQTIEESEKSLNLSNKLEQSLNNLRGVSDAKKEAGEASEKALRGSGTDES